LENKIPEKCPMCGKVLSKKAWINDYASMIAISCEKCGFIAQEKIIGAQ
jgi:transcription elongation factor Elf1